MKYLTMIVDGEPYVHADFSQGLKDEADRLREENARFRKALEWIRHGSEDHAWEVAAKALDADTDPLAGKDEPA